MPHSALRHLCLWLVLISLGGCGLLARQESPAIPTPTHPVWEVNTVQDHLAFFNGSTVGTRQTGTAGFATAAAYVGSRFARFGLQPAVRGSYRMLYPVDLYLLRDARIRLVGADTTRLLKGYDFLPDARSDSGQVTVRTAFWLPGPEESVQQAAVLLTAQEATHEQLTDLRDRGAAQVWIVGALTPGWAAAHIPRLRIVQVRSASVPRLLGRTEASSASLLRANAPRRFDLPHQVRLIVSAERQTLASGLNVVGYVAGKHPAVREEAILICAHLDARGPYAGVRLIDAENFGVDAAAVLEVARMAGYFSEHLPMPERTVIVALWSGAGQNHQGLRAFLRHPTWALDQIKAVVYVGLSEPERPAVEALLGAYDLPLEVLPPVRDTTLFAEDYYWYPPGGTLRQAMLRDADFMAPVRPTLDALEAAGTPLALTQAERLYRVMLRRAVTAAPLLPPRLDSLGPPPRARTETARQ